MDWLLSKKFDYISSDEPEVVIKREKQQPKRSVN